MLWCSVKDPNYTVRDRVRVGVTFCSGAVVKLIQQTHNYDRNVVVVYADVSIKFLSEKIYESCII